MAIMITGKVWKFGDDVNTDYMAPIFGMGVSPEEMKKQILHIHSGFVEGSQAGDVIVAGRNFGCGSSRENAPMNLKLLGIGCVVAESFGRIFFRNCLAIAFPVMACKGVYDLFEEGDQLEMDFENSRIKNLSTGEELKAPALSPDLINIVKSGGILEILKGEG